MAKPPPRSVFARSKELLGLAAKIGQKEISHRVSQLVTSAEPLKRLHTQLEQAKILVESLGRLKGAAMKVGQLLSLESADFLPPEVVEILSRLQNQSPPMPFSDVENILQQNLSPSLRAQITHLSSEPIAAASIGQVHRAQYQNQNIALKIQYPGIADTIASDLSILKKVFAGLLTLGRREVNIDALTTELEAVLMQEVDYGLEAQAIAQFQKIYAEHSDFIIPKVFNEISTPRVLSMSLEEGLKITDWLKSNPTLAEREHLGRLALDTHFIEFFVHGLVQTDPNFANYLYRPATTNQGAQLVLLDFGATRAYSVEFRKEYVQLLKLIRESSAEEIIRHSINMGLIQNNESPECFAAFVSMLKISTDPFDPTRQPFAFGNLDYSQQVRAATSDFIRLVKKSAPPHQLIFLHRKLGGIFSLLKAMNVSLDLTQYWQRLIALSLN